MMSNETNNDSGRSAAAQEQIKAQVEAQKQTLLQLPGLVAIGLYMFLLAGVNVLGVVSGHYRPLFLIFSAVFIASGLGLLLLLRWAWATALAAVVMLAGVFLWQFAHQHLFAYIVQGLLNLVFFLYLVRPEVREKLR